MTLSAAPRSGSVVGRDIHFLLLIAPGSLVILSLLRLLLYLRNCDFAAGIPGSDILMAFLIGLRFDLVAVCYALLPLVAGLYRRYGLGKRRFAIFWYGAVISAYLFAGVVELEFYHEFQARLNNIVLQYMKESPETVARLIWYGFPVIPHVSLWLVLSASFLVFLHWSNRRTAGPRQPADWRRFPLATVILLLIIVGGRGTLRSGPPLRWGDAFHSSHAFANHLPLNATYSLIHAIRAHHHQKNASRWLSSLPSGEALSLTRRMLLTPEETPVESPRSPLLRRLRVDPETPAFRNVVLILMESFSAEFTGVLGGPAQITPFFDELARQGVLFTRFFSNGTHTHQGMFTTLSCFPNLPGYEYLMQEPQGQNRFSGLPVLLEQTHANTYVYNGDFAWDNQEGFFRNQGVTRFFGREDYRNPVFTDPTWGVSDEDMFNQAVIELDRLSAGGRPFYAILQTLSNHVPWALPEHHDLEAVSGYGRLDAHLTAQKYADWALGRFFRQIQGKDYYRDTLFVLVGDHGFGVDRQLSAINLLTYHVPMLLLGEGLQDTWGKRRTTVGTQVDIVPTILGLLGQSVIHQCWGRNLLNLPPDDEGFGIIKPSGGNQVIALIEGDHILVEGPGLAPELGIYHLGKADDYTTVENPDRLSLMDRKLKAYIQTALAALLDNHTGVPR